MLGLGKPKVEPQVKKTEDNKQDKPSANSSQSDEAKALLAKMEAKKESGSCPFC